MRTRKPNATATPKPAPAVETSESIEAQVAAFLSSGGQIQQIAKGVSGQTQPSRHITIGKR
ncbi:hypothetical protein [Pseudomonas matsuisoli]|uniref:Transcriptional regulator SutA RNAP-binding domain-containing protein n=1 Tax=Pseudomonas matsuisoli TaxID=1515666 RepID=A0A917PT19_9PSED|nr:hypothetical protein [Pseudomonas matsuisoli]GGJ90251.1 hypothetical protein GCM10009304_14840 [Pseudomonas matsuisoli]